MAPKRRVPGGAGRPVVWVVGASSGIGREIARRFASIGCLVCISGRRKPRLSGLRKEIESWGGAALEVACDITDPAGVARSHRTIRNLAGPVDVLVNNAGITVFKSFTDTSLAEFTDIVSTNLLGPVACLKAVVPGMKKRRKGWVFNILSTASVRTFEGSAAYTATKAGMLGLGRVLREELRHSNVRVVNVMPGATETDMWSPRDRKMHRRRMMSPAGVADAILAVYLMPEDVLVDEFVVRPVRGDIE